MVLATFNLPQEIRDRLKLEENQSQLVADLLLNHFQDVKAEDIEKKIEKLETQKGLQEQTIEIRIKELKTQLEEKQKIEEEDEKAKAKIEFIKKARAEAVTKI